MRHLSLRMCELVLQVRDLILRMCGLVLQTLLRFGNLNQNCYILIMPSAGMLPRIG
jgi:hypothetical protein